MALATKGEVVLYPIKKESVRAFIEQINQCQGIVEDLGNDSWRFRYNNILKSCSIETGPHPGFMTDWQPPWSLLMTQANGQSIIKERIFENRFAYVEELKKLGAKIEYLDNKINQPEKYFYFNYDKNKTYRQVIQINGNSQLHGAVLNIADLRAGATLVIGALVAKGESVVQGASIVERGYENFIEKVKSLGGQIKKV
jgi:UDP-N-acetylglucosamine 1-carboxyvinyltransferase